MSCLWNQIGNPWTDSYYDNKGAVDFWYYHSLISDETYAEIQKNCDYKVEPAVGFSNSAACQNAANHASNLEMAEIDAYNIYAGNCNSASVNDSKVTKVGWNSDCILYAVSALSPGLRKQSNTNNNFSKKEQCQKVLLWAVLYQLYTMCPKRNLILPGIWDLTQWCCTDKTKLLPGVERLKFLFPWHDHTIPQLAWSKSCTSCSTWHQMDGMQVRKIHGCSCWRCIKLNRKLNTWLLS